MVYNMLSHLFFCNLVGGAYSPIDREARERGRKADGSKMAVFGLLECSNCSGDDKPASAEGWDDKNGDMGSPDKWMIRSCPC